MNTHRLSSQKPECFTILDIPISIVNLAKATDLLSTWAKQSRPFSVFVREVASLMAAVSEPRLAELHYHADLVVPDGAPLVFIARIRGYGKRIGRVPGADLVDALCARSLETGQSHFFYGGKQGVADEMVRQLSLKYPGLVVAGTYSPPMRAIGPNTTFNVEMLEEIEIIRSADPDFIWVGISSPKQEYWIMRACEILERGVLLGVGAAFDFHSGAVSRAPKWMRKYGLEWLHRLVSEPRRLWRRYLVMAPIFAFKSALEQTRILLRHLSR